MMMVLDFWHVWIGGTVLSFTGDKKMGVIVAPTHYYLQNFVDKRQGRIRAHNQSSPYWQRAAFKHDFDLVITALFCFAFDWSDFAGWLFGGAHYQSPVKSCN